MAKNSAKKSRAQKPSQGAMLREELIIRLSELIEITRRVQRETERQLVVSVDRICKVVEESTARSMSATEGFIDDLSDRLDKGLKSRDTENWPMSGYERKLLEQGLTQRDAELRVLRREKDETGETIKQLMHVDVAVVGVAYEPMPPPPQFLI